MLKEYWLLVGRGDAEKLSDALVENGAFSVSIEDADADSLDEEPIFGEPGLEPKELAWRRSRIKALADGSFDIEKALAQACVSLGLEQPAIEKVVEVPDNDWVRITQAQFNPVQITDKLWIVPTWHEPPEPSAINIRLDPGVAFGTGTHPTTRLCLEWLGEHDLKGESVLDYGCGSGILAIAASKLGANPVIGTDIDPQAVEAATLNAENNGSNATFCLPDQLPEKTFDIVVANILSNPLRVLAPALVSRVADGGHLILSGILESQAQELADVYNRLLPKLNMAIWKTADGWVCLTGQKQ